MVIIGLELKKKNYPLICPHQVSQSYVQDCVLPYTSVCVFALLTHM